MRGETDEPFEKRTVGLVCPKVDGGLGEVDAPKPEGFRFSELGR